MSQHARSRRSTPALRAAALLVACVLVACDNQVPSASPVGSASVPSAPGSTSGPDISPGASSPGGSGEPSAESKIDDAEAAGTIDHATGLLYKLFAALDWGSLPPAYRSTSAEIPEGTAVLAQLAAALEDLAPDVRAKVEPFLLRPTEPGSFWQQRAATASANSLSLASYQSAAVIEFAYEDAEKTNVRVWYATELGNKERALAAQLADEIDSSDMWAKERTAMLGHEPCSDGKLASNGGNGRLDVYLVYPSTGLDWGGRSDSLGYDDKGTAHNGVDVQDGPGDGCPVATHILLNAAADFAHLKSTMAHELFHAFQHSFKNAFMPDRSWWGEASATWAKHLVYPEQNFEQPYLKGYWSEAAMPEGRIDSVSGNAAYATYLLAFYLVQESGDATGTVVGRLWAASESAASLAAIAALPDWEDLFKQYALWNWNQGEARKYVDNGVAIPPTSLKQTPACLDSHIQGGSDCILKIGKLEAFFTIPAATVTYLAVVPDQPVVERLTVDLTDVLDRPGLGVQGLLDIGGSGNVKVEDWTGLPKRVFCLDAEDVRKLVLVVSNSKVEEGADISGKITVKAEAGGCSGWQGTMTSTHTWDQGQHRGTATTTFTGLWSIDPLGDPGCQPDFNDDCLVYRPTGTISWTWDAEEDNPSTFEPGYCMDTRSGTEAAGAGRPDQQVFHLNVVDDEHFSYWGDASFAVVSSLPLPKCTDLHGSNFPMGFFSIDERSSVNNPTSDNECFSMTFQIDFAGDTIQGSCYAYRYSYNSLLYTWSLHRVGDATPGH